MDNTTPQAAPVPEKKTLFDTIIFSTPVMLTVIATFILGRSTSEMTQAQYQRAVAGQKQSKVADEWAFFQAKRIRGTTYETTSITLRAMRDEPFSGATLFDAARELAAQTRAAEKDAGEEDSAFQELAIKAAASAKRIEVALDPPKEGIKIKRNLLTPENVKSALDALDTYPKAKLEPSEADKDIDEAQRKLLEEILDDIRKFKPEETVAEKTRYLKDETVTRAMERATARAAAVAEHGKSIDRVLEEFDALVDGQAALSREFQRLLAAQIAKSNKGKDNSNGGEKNLNTYRERARATSSALLSDYKAARFAFDARRYEDDARSNQDKAYLYDVHVLQSSARSDRHLKRSFMFMIAMLVAQVGVTIATLAMMLKYRMPVWAIAALSGVIAIGFGVAVFLELSPIVM